MSVDILLAVRNGEPFLSQQLQSLINQTYEEVTITLRDNASTDRTPDIIREWVQSYPKKITAIYGERDLGVIGNFHFLLDRSEADYVMFCDADDVWMENKVETTLKAMQEKENEAGSGTPVLVHTDLHVVDRDLNMLHPSYWEMTKRHGLNGTTLNRALAENSVTGCTMMLNRALMEKCKPLPETIPMHDSWIYLVAAVFGVVVPLNMPTIYYRQHGNNAAGAHRYGLKSYLQRKTQIDETRKKRHRQARELLDRYGPLMSKEQKELVQTYLSIPSQPLLTRYRLLKQHDLFESGLLRKLHQLFWRAER